MQTAKDGTSGRKNIKISLESRKYGQNKFYKNSKSIWQSLRDSFFDFQKESSFKTVCIITLNFKPIPDSEHS